LQLKRGQPETVGLFVLALVGFLKSLTLGNRFWLVFWKSGQKRSDGIMHYCVKNSTDTSIYSALKSRFAEV
jgi:hypothetical protein